MSTTATAVASAPAHEWQEREPYLIVDKVGKNFGSFVALKSVSLSISAGEFVCFVGPSGCGKTTLLRAIAGLDPPTSGRIIQAGIDITGLPPAKRDFGIVFQSYALFPNMTVQQNVGYGLRGPEWPRSRVRQRVAELIGVVGLQEHARKYPAQLSGGQQQRVALARALASEPGLLLLDEPLSALDAIVRLHLRSEIHALQRRLGVTTIMVTHDQEEALSVSDRLVVMSKGLIEQTGRPEDVYRRPVSAFVAGFVGRSSAFAATVEQPGVVTAKGVMLAAEQARNFPTGAPVRVFVRPEDILVGTTAPSATPLRGRVDSLEYLGPLCRLTIGVGPLAFSADVPSDRVAEERIVDGTELPLSI
ncbi:MAG: ATP-binding cassette domain-containing protein, partial [Acetobacteraceae bacterium]|nr:ATP-binding cassette domain-containing protein [Acetobacteraceae bacterium]